MLGDRARILDSTAIYDAVATQDTVTQLRAAVRKLLAALPERERQVLRLRFVEELTQAEIAERLGVSQMSLSRLLARTLAGLRRRYRDGT